MTQEQFWRDSSICGHIIIWAKSNLDLTSTSYINDQCFSVSFCFWEQIVFGPQNLGTFLFREKYYLGIFLLLSRYAGCMWHQSTSLKKHQYRVLWFNHRLKLTLRLTILNRTVWQNVTKSIDYSRTLWLSVFMTMEGGQITKTWLLPMKWWFTKIRLLT